MSDAWNVSASDEQLESLNLRAKYVMSQLQVVLTGTYQRKSVSEIARQLGCSRDKIIWMQHVLQLRWTGRAQPGQGKAVGKWPRAPAEEAA